MSKTLSLSFKLPPPEYYKSHFEYAVKHGDYAMAEIYARVEPQETVDISAKYIIMNSQQVPRYMGHLLKILMDRGAAVSKIVSCLKNLGIFAMLAKWPKSVSTMILIDCFDKSTNKTIICELLKLAFERNLTTALEYYFAVFQEKGILYDLKGVYSQQALLGRLEDIHYYPGYRNLIRNILRSKLVKKFDDFFFALKYDMNCKIRRQFVLVTEHLSLSKRSTSAMMALKAWLKFPPCYNNENMPVLYRVILTINSKFPDILKSKNNIDQIVDLVMKNASYRILHILYMLLVQFHVPVDFLEDSLISSIYMKIANATVHYIDLQKAPELFGLLGTKVDLNINQRNYSHKMTVLSHLLNIKKTQQKTIRFLLALGANPMIADSNGNNALHHAALKYNNSITRDLMFRDLLAVEGVDVNVKNNYGLTPLQIINSQGRVPSARYQLSMKANEI